MFKINNPIRLIIFLIVLFFARDVFASSLMDSFSNEIPKIIRENMSQISIGWIIALIVTGVFTFAIKNGATEDALAKQMLQCLFGVFIVTAVWGTNSIYTASSGPVNMLSDHPDKGKFAHIDFYFAFKKASESIGKAIFPGATAEKVNELSASIALKVEGIAEASACNKNPECLNWAYTKYVTNNGVDTTEKPSDTGSWGIDAYVAKFLSWLTFGSIFSLIFKIFNLISSIFIFFTGIGLVLMANISLVVFMLISFISVIPSMQDRFWAATKGILAASLFSFVVQFINGLTIILFDILNSALGEIIRDKDANYSLALIEAGATAFALMVLQIVALKFVPKIASAIANGSLDQLVSLGDDLSNGAIAGLALVGGAIPAIGSALSYGLNKMKGSKSKEGPTNFSDIFKPRPTPGGGGGGGGAAAPNFSNGKAGSYGTSVPTPNDTNRFNEPVSASSSSVMAGPDMSQAKQGLLPGMEEYFKNDNQPRTTLQKTEDEPELSIEDKFARSGGDAEQLNFSDEMLDSKKNIELKSNMPEVQPELPNFSQTPQGPLSPLGGNDPINEEPEIKRAKRKSSPSKSKAKNYGASAPSGSHPNPEPRQSTSSPVDSKKPDQKSRIGKVAGAIAGHVNLHNASSLSKAVLKSSAVLAYGTTKHLLSHGLSAASGNHGAAENFMRKPVDENYAKHLQGAKAALFSINTKSNKQLKSEKINNQHNFVNKLVHDGKDEKEITELYAKKFGKISESDKEKLLKGIEEKRYQKEQYAAENDFVEYHVGQGKSADTIMEEYHKKFEGVSEKHAEEVRTKIETMISKLKNSNH